MKKIVIKTNIKCQICKTEALKTVTKLSGIDQISVDGEKQTLTVIGDVDPVLVIKQLKKIGMWGDIVSVGPPKPKPPNSPIKIYPLPPCCYECQVVPVGYSHSELLDQLPRSPVEEEMTYSRSKPDQMNESDTCMADFSEENTLILL